MDKNQIKKNINAHRECAGIRQYELAKKLGISAPTLRFKLKDPGRFSLDEVFKMMEIFRINSIDEIIFFIKRYTNSE